MMRIRSSMDLLARLRDFARGRSGAAAIEFAVLLPFMLVLYIGGVELSDAIAIDRKVTITARSVADLASQFTTIKNADMTNILNAATALMSPYSAAGMAVTVSEVTTDNTGKATITWTDTKGYGATVHAIGAAVTLPNSFAAANASLIWSEVKYSYTPALGYVLTGIINLSNQMYLSPRNSAAVTRFNG